jgi:hypothetical protein
MSQAAAGGLPPPDCGTKRYPAGTTVSLGYETVETQDPNDLVSSLVDGVVMSGPHAPGWTTAAPYFNCPSEEGIRIGRLVLPRTALVAGRRLRMVLVVHGGSLRARLSFFRHPRAGGRRLVGRRSVALGSKRQVLSFAGPRRGKRFRPGRYSIRIDLLSDGLVRDTATRRFRVLR